MKVVIMRGPSGSGKSHKAQEILARNLATGTEGVIVSADQYFTTSGGEYDFDVKKIPQAHNDCFMRFLEALEKQVDLIIVDNTNIHLWEWERYAKVADLMGYSVEVIACVPLTVADVKNCIERNTHGTPADIIMKQAIEYELDERYTFGVLNE